MRNRKKSQRFGIAYRLLALPAAAVLVLSARAETTNNSYTITTEGDTVFKVVEEPPQFPNGTQAMFEYLNQNTYYPQEAWDNAEEGRVIVGFVVSHTGEVHSAQILRGASPALNEEAVRVISSMPIWTPGKHLGHAVNVLYTLPIIFKIPADSLPIIMEKKKVYPLDEVEEKPEFPDGQQALFGYLSRNLRYPADAVEAGAQGRIVVTFTVTSEGKITDPKVEQSVYPSLDFEAVRVILSMPDWKPGRHEGKAVNVRCSLPVNFGM